MFVNTFFRRIVFNVVSLVVFFIIYFLLFYDVYTSDNIIISFAVHPFNICERYPDVWFKIKMLCIPTTVISSLIYINILYSTFFTKQKKERVIYPKNTTDLSLVIRNDMNNNPITIPESGLYQNFLITGTIGSGKTSSVMYPFTRQFIRYKHDNNDLKLGMLILDVKGNYYSQVKKYAEFYKRDNDLIVIELRSAILSITH